MAAATSIMNKSRASNAILRRLRLASSSSFSGTSQSQQQQHQTPTYFLNHGGFGNRNLLFSTSSEASNAAGTTNVREFLAEVERERKWKDREQRRRGAVDDDYMGVAPLIEKLEKESLRNAEPRIISLREEPSDDENEEDDHRFSPASIRKRREIFERKFKRHEDLLKNFTQSDNIDDAFKWMSKIDKFEQKHLALRPEYRVIEDLMEKLKQATTMKEKFLLQHKLNRAVRLVNWKEAYDPNNPANYGVIENRQASHNVAGDSDDEKGSQFMKGEGDESEEEEYDDMKEKDDILLQKLNAIDRKLEEKLGLLDHTFGRKGKVLEQEIKDLAEERNSLTEKKRKPLYRKGFDVKLIDVNRTVKVTKGGQLAKFSVLVACGNHHGVIGFATGKGPRVNVACQKALEKCFQNLHYVERHEEHTIAHAVQTSFKRTKVYLWPGSAQSGMKAGKTVQTMLQLAGLKNVKSKVIGSRNPQNTVKAVLKALNAIETPKDVQEKFGRTVVQTYLL